MRLEALVEARDPKSQISARRPSLGFVFSVIAFPGNAAHARAAGSIARFASAPSAAGRTSIGGRVCLLSQGEIPDGLVDDIAKIAASATGWNDVPRVNSFAWASVPECP